MTKQPEALRLSEALETPNHPFTQSQAAAELRRLHEEVKCEERRFNDLWDQFAALDKVNQELLEALKAIFPNNLNAINKNVPDTTVISLDFTYGELRKIRAAIAKAEVSV